MSHEDGQLEAQLDELAGEMDILKDETSVRTGRRRRRGGESEPGEAGLTMNVLRRDDDLLVLREHGSAGPVRRRGRGDAGVEPGETVSHLKLRQLAPSELWVALQKLDKKLTPEAGETLGQQTGGSLTGVLLQLNEAGDAWVPCPSAPAIGRVLLFVHGTFSNNATTLKQFRATDHGTEFLNWAKERYDAILAFDHPTLSVSPILNARDLGFYLRDARRADIDVICHSRGGLVTRWWLEAFDQTDEPWRRRAVFVGAPLQGTGLAAPPNIRGALDLFFNFGHALAGAFGTVPFLSVAMGLFQIVSSVANMTAKTPIVDALVGLVPGLASMSRVGNNLELLSQRRSVPADFAARYFVVKSNFESENPGWRFWRHFRKGNIADRGADVVFDGENDLVVDTSSMNSFTSEKMLADPDRVLDFGTGAVVHHCNYFEQRELMAKLVTWYGRGPSAS